MSRSVLQGNTSYGNSQLLLQTKLVSILERLVEKTVLEGAQDGADAVPKLTKPTTSDETVLEGAQDDASHLSKLRVSSLTLLAAACRCLPLLAAACPRWPLIRADSR